MTPSSSGFATRSTASAGCTALDELRFSRERLDDCVGIRDPAEEPLDHEQRGLVVRAGEAGADRLGGAVLEHDAGVVPEHRVAERRLNADARGAAGDEQLSRAETLQ